MWKNVLETRFLYTTDSDPKSSTPKATCDQTQLVAIVPLSTLTPMITPAIASPPRPAPLEIDCNTVVPETPSPPPTPPPPT